MTLKWMAVVVAAVSVTLCATANVLVGSLRGPEVPVLLNLIAIATSVTGVVIAVVAELYERLNGRIAALTEFLVARLNELDTHAGDHNAGFVEGYLLSHSPDGAVVPIGSRPRSRRARTGGEE